MRTLMIIGGGLLLLGVFLLVARGVGGGANPALAAAAKYFLPVWLALAALNLWVGVTRAGYSVAEELPIFLAIFAIPAAAAVILWRKFA